jgi:hypothetical protein
VISVQERAIKKRYRWVMRSRGLVVGAAALAAVVSGCVTPNRVVYNAVNQPPRAFQRKPAAAVEVLVGGPTVRPHVDVGIFEVHGGTGENNLPRTTEDMVASLRVHAGLRGCDAVQVMDFDQSTKHRFGILRGVCEIYTDAATAQAAAPTADRLPTEGLSCEVNDASPQTCVDPMVCQQGRCVSPYH